MQVIKETRRRGTRRDLNGSRTNSEEPNPSGRNAIGLKHPNPTPFSIGTHLKSGSEHRPATKPKLFKPILYKSYCEGPFTCEPKDINGPQRNRVLTIVFLNFSLLFFILFSFFFLSTHFFSFPFSFFLFFFLLHTFPLSLSSLFFFPFFC